MTTKPRPPSRAGPQTTAAARAMATIALTAHWQSLNTGRPLRPFPADTEFRKLTELTAEELNAAERTAGLIPANDSIPANHLVSSLYNSFMDEDARYNLGAHYTPPSLSARMADLIQETGFNWQSSRVLEPACGTGALMLPVAKLIIKNQPHSQDPAETLRHLREHLTGFEIDPFTAWIAQVFLDAEMSAIPGTERHDLPWLVETKDTIGYSPTEQYDLVLANPPYRKVNLTPLQRARFGRSISGNPNICTLFADQALRLTAPGGVVALITPTSLLSGRTFRALRATLDEEAFPLAVNFVSQRRNVFQNVLQEVVLTLYRKRTTPPPAAVYSTTPAGLAGLSTAVGTFRVPDNPEQPWLIPREPAQDPLVHRAMQMKHRLIDYGYQVHTGPLVWNRHKDLLTQHEEPGSKPIIWSWSILPNGGFRFPVRNPKRPPYIRLSNTSSKLATHHPCILVKRTTAMEQDRRLVAAELPPSFLAAHGSVVVENHINMLVPNRGKPKVSAATLTAVLNSRTLDRIFRCITGSAAVSVYDLTSLPLPSPEQAAKLEQLLQQPEHAGPETGLYTGLDTELQTKLETELASLYIHGAQPASGD